MNFICDICGYIYDEEVGDPDSGVSPGTKFEDIPEDWVCPCCGAEIVEFSYGMLPLYKTL